MVVMGIDAGGTKTHCVIGDEKERILGEGISGAAQHQIYGIEQTKKNLRAAVDAALAEAGLGLSEISYAVLGMSGADGKDDFDLLIPAVGEVLGEVPHEIVHDSWIGLRSALDRSVGVVSICGTGAGHAGENARGEKLILRNLDYRTGNCGGGGDLAEKALHYAFRSEEGTYDKSLLEQMVPEVFGVSSMEEVCSILKHDGCTAAHSYRLPIAVFEAAHRGDQVACRLISDMGYEEGRYAAAVVKRLHMEEEEVPVVLIGSLFHTGDELLIGPFMRAVRETASRAYPVIPDRKPVIGALRMALDHIRQTGIGQVQASVEQAGIGQA